MSDRQTELLEEAVKWLRLMGIQEAYEVIQDVLSSDDEEWQNSARITYELSNGDNTTKDIAQYIPFSYRWVAYRQREWANLGIIHKEGAQEPYEHIISLDELGIDYPSIQNEGETE
jgi:predicted transcriptional regulator